MEQMDRDLQKLMSKTFCVYPWMHQMVDTDGSVKLCCIAETPTKKPEGSHMHVSKNKLSDLWNDPYMVNVRQRMLNGEQVKDCGQCYRKEKRNEFSFRQKANNDWDIDSTNTTLINLPKYLDIRFGNLCNLRCRMCTGMYSSELGEELESIADKNEQFRLLGPDSAKIYTFDWYSDESKIWVELEKYVRFLDLIYLTGGEPTLVEGNYKFLQKLIDSEDSKRISLVFNTNVTNAQKRFLNIISKFKRISLNLSIDGTEGTQEYIRYPSKWKTITKNLNTIVEHSKTTETGFDFNFTPAVSIINVANFNSLIEWAYNLAINNQHKNITWDMQSIFLHGPEFMDMIHSTVEYRNLCLDNLNKVTKEQLQFFPCLEKFYNEVVNTLKNKFEHQTEADSYRKQLKLWNDEIDKKRKISIHDYFNYAGLLYE
jgi:MoaA/NifB/PqqE/SkfB family radical SAM enzyme